MIRAEDIPLPRRILAMAVLLAGYFFYAMSWNTVDVLRPYIAESLRLNLTQAGSVYSLQALGALFGAVINGQIADRIGRRNALMIVMTAFGATLISGMFVTTYIEVLIQRLVLGYFTGSMFPITVGIYSGLFSSRIRGRVAGLALGAYNAAVSLLGLAAAFLFAHHIDWRMLLLIGIAPVALSVAVFFLIPDDRRVRSFGVDAQPGVQPGKLPITELFAADVRQQTFRLVLMTGLNFFAYQAFTGWATTYLKTVRHFSDPQVGAAVGWQFAGACLGGLSFGWVGDRFGRRSAGAGFVAAAGLVCVYLFVPLDVTGLQATGFLYGVMLSASVVWGPWLAELYEPHLRSTAASIYNWGRIVSFTAPLITAQIAGKLGLGAAMATAAVSFLLAAMIWFSLPETVRPQVSRRT